MHCHVIEQIQRSLNGRIEDQLPRSLLKFENTTNLAAKRNLKLEGRTTPKLLETGRSVVGALLRTKNLKPLERFYCNLVCYLIMSSPAAYLIRVKCTTAYEAEGSETG